MPLAELLQKYNGQVLDDPQDDFALPEWMRKYNPVVLDAEENQPSEPEQPEWLTGKPTADKYANIRSLEEQLASTPEGYTSPGGIPVWENAARKLQIERAYVKGHEQQAAEAHEKFKASGLAPESYAQKLRDEELLATEGTASLPPIMRGGVEAALSVRDFFDKLGSNLIGNYPRAERIRREGQRRQEAVAAAGRTPFFTENVGGPLGTVLKAGEQTAEFLDPVAQVLGETAAIASTGVGLPGVASYYGAKIFQDIMQETGDLQYATWAAGIEFGTTMVGGKILGAGVGRLASTLGGQKTGSLLGGIASKALAKHKVPAKLKRVLPALGGGSMETTEELVAETLHAANEYLHGHNPDAFKGLGNRLWETAKVAAPAGVIGGGLASRQRLNDLSAGMKQAADEVRESMKGVQAALDSELAEPPPTSRRGFEQATGIRKTTQPQREAFAETVAAKATEAPAEAVPEQTAPEQPATEPVRPAAAEAAAADMESVVRSAIPTVSAVEMAPDGTVLASLPNGRQIGFRRAERIAVSDKDLTRVMRDYGVPDSPETREVFRAGIQGSFTLDWASGPKDAMGLVQLWSGLQQPKLDKVALHEVVHAYIENGMMADSEFNSLVDKYSSRDKDLLQQAEDIAQASALWRNRGSDSLLGKIRNWLRDLILRFSGASRLVADRAEQAVVSGEMASRPAKPTTEAVADMAAAIGQRGYVDQELVARQLAALESRPQTAIKNAVVDEERAALEMTAIAPHTPETVKGWESQAKAALNENPSLGEQLATEVIATPRQFTDVENIVMLRHRARVRNGFNDVLRELDQALKAGDQDAISQLSFEAERYSDKLTLADKALRKAGSEWGKAGRARQIPINRDLTLADMIALKRSAVGGRSLTDTEMQHLRDLESQVQKLQSQLDQRAVERASAKHSAGHRAVTAEAKKDSKAGKPKEKPSVELPEDFTPAQFSTLARELAKHFIRQGVTGRVAVTDAVHAELKRIVPDLKIRDTQDAISLYGQFSELSKDADKVRLREISGELQQIAKLLDMKQGEAPLKTGQERRAPTDTERQLIKLVNEAKKKYNLSVTDPAKQLQSALASRKTRLRNQIKDLEREIKARQRTIKQKGQPPTDAEVEALIAERDALKAEHEAIFGKPELTPQQQLERSVQAAERSQQEYERRIAERDFTNPQKPPILSHRLEDAKAKRDAARALYQELRALDPRVQADKQQRAEFALQRRLADKAADLTMRLAQRDFGPRSRAAKPESSDPLTKKLQEDFDALREKFDEELYVDRTRRRLEAEKERLDHQISTGILSERPVRQGRTTPQSLEQLEYQVKVRRKKIRAEQARRKPRSLLSKAFEPVRLARTLLLGVDFGQVLRQGKLAMGHPLLAAKQIGPMFEAMDSEQGESAINRYIEEHPLAPLAAKAGLDLTMHEGPLTQQEEIFQGHLADKVPGIAAFGRAYQTYLNKLRFDWFISGVDAIGMGGEMPVEQAKVLANMINVSTGRGAVAERYSGALVFGNDLFLAPRYQISRFQWLLGQPIWGAGKWSETGKARRWVTKEYTKQLVGLGLYYTLLTSLASMVFDDEEVAIELDPRSSDFGKIRIGEIRIDPLAGVQQWAHLAAKLVTGEKKTLDGKVQEWTGYQAQSDVARFFRGRLSPLPGAIWDRYVAGQTPDRQEATILQLTKNLFIPITPKEIYEGLQEHGVSKGSALGLMALFGETINTYNREQSKKPTSDYYRQQLENMSR